MTVEICVFADWLQLDGPQYLGLLRVERTQGKETFSFEYARQWLERGDAFQLDPVLLLYEGPQYLSDGERPNFGMFLDSCPDRWGQLLMKRREAQIARQEGRRPRVLLSSDYLLGVDDEQRMGGLRFKTHADGEFVSNERDQPAPPWARLRELEYAAWKIQAEGESDRGEDERKWLRLLMAPGSSIGGARPKAGVCDEEQHLWIAKFPSRSDQVDVGAWEELVHRLATRCGIRVAESKVQKFGLQHSTFMVKRFDREVINGQRVRKHFASAMTMLGYSDGASFKDGASYLEIVEFLTRHGAETEADLRELWRRIVFSICVSNTDDHLRNHGFLLESSGWRLSPAYDINPDPAGIGLSLNITETENALDLELAKEIAEYFRIAVDEAREIVDSITRVVAGWRELATDLRISRSEQQMMSPAFRVAEESR